MGSGLGGTLGSLGGAGLGFAVGGPFGAALGGALGGQVGGLFDDSGPGREDLLPFGPRGFIAEAGFLQPTGTLVANQLIAELFGLPGPLPGFLGTSSQARRGQNLGPAPIARAPGATGLSAFGRELGTGSSGLGGAGGFLRGVTQFSGNTGAHPGTFIADPTGTQFQATPGGQILELALFPERNPVLADVIAGVGGLPASLEESLGILRDEAVPFAREVMETGLPTDLDRVIESQQRRFSRELAPALAERFGGIGGSGLNAALATGARELGFDLGVLDAELQERATQRRLAGSAALARLAEGIPGFEAEALAAIQGLATGLDPGARALGLLNTLSSISALQPLSVPLPVDVGENQSGLGGIFSDLLSNPSLGELGTSGPGLSGLTNIFSGIFGGGATAPPAVPPAGIAFGL